MKSVVLFCLRYSGALHVWRFWHRHSVTIVMVHGVMDASASDQWMPLRPQLSTSQLEAFLSALGRHYHFVTLDEAAEMLTGHRPMRPYSLVVTLDDGYRNQVKYAGPVLTRHHVPHVIYVVPRQLEQQRPFWFDRLDFALQHLPANVQGLRVGTVQVPHIGTDREQLRAAFTALRRRVKTEFTDDLAMRDELERLAESIERQSDKRLQDVFDQDDWSGLLTWREIEQHRSPLTTFGSHTMDHVQVTNVDAVVLEHQLSESKARIEAHVGSCRHLCYPYGAHNAEAVDAARRIGYATAVTDVEGVNPRGSDLLALRRINLDHHSSVTRMLVTVSGLSTALARGRAVLRAKLLKPIQTLFSMRSVPTW